LDLGVRQAQLDRKGLRAFQVKTDKMALKDCKDHQVKMALKDCKVLQVHQGKMDKLVQEAQPEIARVLVIVP
jgi:hypothetical protein